MAGRKTIGGTIIAVLVILALAAWNRYDYRSCSVERGACLVVDHWTGNLEYREVPYPDLESSATQTGDSMVEGYLRKYGRR